MLTLVAKTGWKNRPKSFLPSLFYFSSQKHSPELLSFISFLVTYVKTFFQWTSAINIYTKAFAIFIRGMQNYILSGSESKNCAQVNRLYCETEKKELSKDYFYTMETSQWKEK